MIYRNQLGPFPKHPRKSVDGRCHGELPYQLTKAVSSKMNFGQIMLVRGLIARVLIAALAWPQRAMRPQRALRTSRRRLGPDGDRELAVGQYRGNPAGTAIGRHAWGRAAVRGARRLGRWLAITTDFIGIPNFVRPGVEGLASFRCSRRSR